MIVLPTDDILIWYGFDLTLPLARGDFISWYEATRLFDVECNHALTIVDQALPWGYCPVLLPDGHDKTWLIWPPCTDARGVVSLSICYHAIVLNDMIWPIIRTARILKRRLDILLAYPGNIECDDILTMISHKTCLAWPQFTRSVSPARGQFMTLLTHWID